MNPETELSPLDIAPTMDEVLAFNAKLMEQNAVLMEQIRQNAVRALQSITPTLPQPPQIDTGGELPPNMRQLIIESIIKSDCQQKWTDVYEAVRGYMTKRQFENTCHGLKHDGKIAYSRHTPEEVRVIIFIGDKDIKFTRRRRASRKRHG